MPPDKFRTVVNTNAARLSASFHNPVEAADHALSRQRKINFCAQTFTAVGRAVSFDCLMAIWQPLYEIIRRFLYKLLPKLEAGDQT